MSRFITNVLKLVSGSVIAQALGILLIPIITRLYTPGDYGVFQLFISISSIIVVISCLSYQMAIMLPKEDEDSVNIVALCFTLVLSTSIITGSIFIIFSRFIGDILNTPDLSQYLIFLPFFVFLNGSFMVLNYWMIRRTQFGGVATANVTNSITTKVVQIGTGVSAASPLGLIVGLIAGYGAALLIMIQRVRGDLTLFRSITPEKTKAVAIRYKRFPLLTSWSTVSNSLSLQITPLMLAAFFSPVIVGFYGMAYIVVSMPMSLIGHAIGQVFFQKASEEKNRTGSVKTVVREVHHRLVSFGIFPMLVLMIIGEELFGFVLGAQWSFAGEYASILAPWLLFVFIASPLTTIFNVLEKQAVALSFNLMMLFSRIVVLYIGGVYGDPLVTLVLYSVTGVFFWGSMNLYILKISGVSYQEGLRDFAISLFIAVGIAIPLMLVKFISQSVMIFITVAGIMTIIYYGVIISRDPLLKEQFQIMLKVIRP